MSNNSPTPSWRRNSNTFLTSPATSASSYSTYYSSEDDLHVPLLNRSQDSPAPRRRLNASQEQKVSLLRSSLTINRPPPDPEKPANTQRSLQDFIIILLVLLLSESARGIVLPTFSPFVELIGGNAVWLGFAVGAFSAGRFGSTIGLGYLSDKLSYKVVLGWSVLICVIGNVFYSFSDALGLWCMIGSRAVTGFGAGTLSVIRAYTAHITTPAERTRYMSILGAVQFFGFAIMPGVGSAISYIPEFDINGLRFNKYTLPGYFLAIVNLLVLIVFCFFFQNPAPTSSTPSPPPATNRVSSPLNRSGNTSVVQINRSNNGITSAATPTTTTTSGDTNKAKKYLIFGIFLTLNLMVRLVLGVIETLGTPMYMDIWPNSQGKDVEAGFVFGALGLIGMGVLFAISYLSKKLSDLAVMIAGLVCLLAGSAFLVGDSVGLARFIIGCGLIWCIGYPLSQTIIVSMFSKALGSAPQGGWMGWIGAMGSAGRVVGPIISGSLYHNHGQTWTMVFCVGVSFISLLVSLLLVQWRKPKVTTTAVTGAARF
eukprot:TRINITY_DN2622_c0_g1_i1.p1 TRINITY_DN2622_c0_g1~~TRINITY_DN2622_c0_g1_i1.p1  ORF type:complete len:540 (+),score=148.99 TRINITY_DN2622_c0_g1_i1:143-1762(+)